MTNEDLEEYGMKRLDLVKLRKENNQSINKQRPETSKPDKFGCVREIKSGRYASKIRY